MRWNAPERPTIKEKVNHTPITRSRSTIIPGPGTIPNFFAKKK
jgi:hypothetical protein